MYTSIHHICLILQKVFVGLHEHPIEKCSRDIYRGLGLDSFYCLKVEQGRQRSVWFKTNNFPQ